MKSPITTYLTAALVGAALAGLAVNPEPLVLLFPLLALGSGPIIILLMIRTAMKAPGTHDGGTTSLKQERLRTLRAKLESAAVEQETPNEHIDRLEAEDSLSSRPVVIEAERIARAAAKRRSPSSDCA